MPGIKAFLGLGSNLGNKAELLQQAVEKISDLAGELIVVSPVYESEPWGFTSNDHFLNSVVEIQTSLSAHQLLLCCKDIERQLGRTKVPGDVYQSRIIDIDLLFYGDSIIQTDEMKIPHPHIDKRLFVLLPMKDIAPDFIHPLFKKSILELTKICNDDSFIVKLTP